MNSKNTDLMTRGQNQNKNRFSENSTKIKGTKTVTEIPKGRISPNLFKKIKIKFGKIKDESLKNEGLFKIVFSFIFLAIRWLLLFIDHKIESFLNSVRYFPEPVKEEQELFNLLKDRLDVVFDVGVRYDLYFYRIKQNCQYHLFEPNKKFIKILKTKLLKIKNHGLKLNEFGLADKNVNDCVYYKNSQSFEINPYLGEDKDSGERYSTKTLDSYVVENSIPKIDFLKIDTEGFDYKVMLGGIKSIQSDMISYIQFEYWTGVKKFVDFLENKYDLYLMMEPYFLKEIIERFYKSMSEGQKKIDYSRSLIKLDNNVVDLIDCKLAPIGIGGNIFAVNKNIKDKNIEALITNVSISNFSGKPQSYCLSKYRWLKNCFKPHTKL